MAAAERTAASAFRRTADRGVLDATCPSRVGTGELRARRARLDARKPFFIAKGLCAGGARVPRAATGRRSVEAEGGVTMRRPRRPHGWSAPIVSRASSTTEPSRHASWPAAHLPDAERSLPTALFFFCARVVIIMSWLKQYGEWAVVSGASGQDRPRARGALAAGGLSLVLVARRTGALRALADEAGGARHHFRVVATDLSKGVGRRGRGAKTMGLLVAAAGFGSVGRFDASLDIELAMVDVNCRTSVPSPFRSPFRGPAAGHRLADSLLAFRACRAPPNMPRRRPTCGRWPKDCVGLRPSGRGPRLRAGPDRSGTAARAPPGDGTALERARAVTRPLHAVGKRRYALAGCRSSRGVMFLGRWLRVASYPS